MLPHFKMFARYNEWANRRLYAHAAAVSDADYRAERGAFFGSVHGTLNHMLVTDQIWMRRFTGEGPTHPRLDLILYEELPALRESREAEDARIIAWIDALDDEKLARHFTIARSPVRATSPSRWRPRLAHFFNHQTHHRGQLHGLLTAIGGRDAAPILDLILFQRETGIGISS